MEGKDRTKEAIEKWNIYHTPQHRRNNFGPDTDSNERAPDTDICEYRG